ncbi:unnamed protein product [Urochloa humidicola]
MTFLVVPDNSSTKTQKSYTKKRYLCQQPAILLFLLYWFCYLVIVKHEVCVFTCRSHPSPEKKISKKLFTGEEAGDDNDVGGSGIGAADHSSPSKGA